MIQGLSVLGLIPARGGSKGLPRKHLLEAGGRPLLAWTIEAARGAATLDRCVLSSDDEEIMAVARRWGCEVPFRRPDALATDTATSMDVVMHALDALPGHDVVVLLQPTSPLRSAADIDAAVEHLLASGAPACVSVSPVEESPYWMYTIGENRTLRPLIDTGTTVSRRQDLPAVYKLNGAVYVARTEWLRRTRSFVSEQTVAYLMPSARSIDIDTQEDFEAFQRAV